MLGGYENSLGALDATIADASAASVTFSDFATVLREQKDSDGKPVLVETDEGQSKAIQTVYEGPANLVKSGRPRFVTEAGGREDIADWEAETPLTYNPEPGDLVLIGGFLHYCKGSNEGQTNATVRIVYLLRKGRDNEGF